MNPPPPPLPTAFLSRPNRIDGSVLQVRESIGNKGPLPLLVKIAPDLSALEKEDIAAVALETKASGYG